MCYHINSVKDFYWSNILLLGSASRYGSGGHHYHRHHFGGSGNGVYGVGGSNVDSSGRHNHHHHHHHMRGIYAAGGGGSSVYEAPSSMMSSDLESTSFFESDGESSRWLLAQCWHIESFDSLYGFHKFPYQYNLNSFIPFTMLGLICDFQGKVKNRVGEIRGTAPCSRLFIICYLGTFY